MRLYLVIFLKGGQLQARHVFDLAGRLAHSHRRDLSDHVPCGFNRHAFVTLHQVCDLLVNAVVFPSLLVGIFRLDLFHTGRLCVKHLFYASDRRLLADRFFFFLSPRFGGFFELCHEVGNLFDDGPEVREPVTNVHLLFLGSVLGDQLLAEVFVLATSEKHHVNDVEKLVEKRGVDLTQKTRVLLELVEDCVVAFPGLRDLGYLVKHTRGFRDDLENHRSGHSFDILPSGGVVLGCCGVLVHRHHKVPDGRLDDLLYSSVHEDVRECEHQRNECRGSRVIDPSCVHIGELREFRTHITRECSFARTDLLATASGHIKG